MPILTTSPGVENRDEISVATKERAFLDMLYLYGDYHFDNLNGLDWSKVYEILPIYQNQRMTSQVHRIHKQVNQSNEQQ